MSRYFERDIIPANSGFITLSAGSVATTGPLSVALVFRIDSTVGDRDLMSVYTAGDPGSLVWALNESGGSLFFGIGGGFVTCASVSANTWYLWVGGKDAGSAMFRDHLCDMATGEWTHANRGTLGNGVGTPDHVYLGRAYGPYLGGYIAAGGTAPVNLSDAQAEALRPGLLPWVSAGIAPLWRLNDVPVTDLGSTGANQIAIQGTTVNTGVEPPSFDYSTTVVVEPPAEPEVITGGGWNSYLAILRDNEREYRLYKEQELYHPVACPNDGEPLRQGPDGRPYCPYDGWRPDLVGSA